MFILRSINKKTGVASNREIGERYTLTFKGTDEFDKIMGGSAWESACEDNKLIGAFISNHNGRIEALVGYYEYYIMTETGKTFEKIFVYTNIKEMRVTNFKELECHSCFNHRTKDEFYNLNLGGMCQKCYDILIKKVAKMNKDVEKSLKVN